jgi:hypothetical protein
MEINQILFGPPALWNGPLQFKFYVSNVLNPPQYTANKRATDVIITLIKLMEITATHNIHFISKKMDTTWDDAT